MWHIILRKTVKGKKSYLFKLYLNISMIININFLINVKKKNWASFQMKIKGLETGRGN